MTRRRFPHPSRAIVFACACACAVVASAQPDPATYFNRDDFSSEALYATGETVTGARALGLAGAFAAIADDVSALHYNPAGLAQIRGVELALGMRHERDRAEFDMFASRARENTAATGLDYIAFAFPVPTYRGSLVLAAGAERARNNNLESARVDRRSDTDFAFDDRFLRRQEGGVWRYAGGLAVDVLPELSLGFGIAYWHGTLRDDQLREIDEVIAGDPPFRARDRLRSETTVDGFGFDIGLLSYIGRNGRVGLRIASPVWLDLSGDGELSLDDLDDGQPASVDLLIIEQEPRLPWSATLAGSWFFGPALAALDLGYTAWDEVDLDDRIGDAPPVVESEYTSRLSLRTGLEVALPGIPVRVRGGYAFEPVAYDLLLGNPSRLTQDRHVVSAGAGVLVAERFALDLGASFADYERADRDFAAVSETRKERRVVLTGAYRY